MRLRQDTGQLLQLIKPMSMRQGADSLFNRADEMEMGAYNQQAPQMGSPVGSRDLLPLLGAVALVKLLGASGKGVNSGLQGFVGARQQVRGQEYENQVNTQRMGQQKALTQAEQLRARGDRLTGNANQLEARRFRDQQMRVEDQRYREKVKYDRNMDEKELAQKAATLKSQDDARKLNAINQATDNLRQYFESDLKNFGFISAERMGELTKMRNEYAAMYNVSPDALPLPPTAQSISLQKFEESKSQFQERLGETKRINTQRIAKMKGDLEVAKRRAAAYEQAVANGWSLGNSRLAVTQFNAETGRYNAVARNINSELDRGISGIEKELSVKRKALAGVSNPAGRAGLVAEITALESEKQFLNEQRETEVPAEILQGSGFGIQPEGSAPVSPFAPAQAPMPSLGPNRGMSGIIGGAPNGGTRATGATPPKVTVTSKKTEEKPASNPFGGARAGATAGNPSAKSADRKEGLQLIQQARAKGQTDLIQKIKKRFREKYKEEIG